MMKTKRLFIVGDSAFAEIAYEYFMADSDYEVVGFAVEAAYLKQSELFGLPVVPLEQVGQHFQPEDTEFYAAIVYSQLNRLRHRLYTEVKALGYRPASYISSRAFVWRNVALGEHCFIFEDNTVQPFVTIGDNVVLWSGNHIGHHSRVEDNCFISSHVVISGFCNIGCNSFLGVNATIANNITVGADNWVGPSATIMKDTDKGAFFRTVHSEVAKISAPRFFRIAGE